MPVTNAVCCSEHNEPTLPAHLIKNHLYWATRCFSESSHPRHCALVCALACALACALVCALACALVCANDDDGADSS